MVEYVDMSQSGYGIWYGMRLSYCREYVDMSQSGYGIWYGMRLSYCRDSYIPRKGIALFMITRG
mgnify:CR=1 FL=1